MLKGFLFMTKKNGLPCKKCGTSEWYADGHCKKCSKERSQVWGQANPEKRKESFDKYRRNNPEKRRESETKYRINNPEKRKESETKYRINNPDKRRESETRYRRNNPEKRRESVNKWIESNPDKVNAGIHRRRTRKTNAGGSYTADEWKALCNHYGNKCLRCGRDDVKLTFDHVLPVSKGGTSDISNGQPLCKSCNSAKKDRHIDYRHDTGPTRWIQCKIFG